MKVLAFTIILFVFGFAAIDLMWLAQTNFTYLELLTVAFFDVIVILLGMVYADHVYRKAPS